MMDIHLSTVLVSFIQINQYQGWKEMDLDSDE